MKSYNHLFEQYISEENYRLAVKNATKHKGGKKRKFEKAHYYKENVDRLMPQMLRYAGNFKSDPHTPKLIYDGIRRKQRSIVVPTMREQVVHHMAVNVLKPIFMKGMYEHSYGSIPGRGASSGRGKHKGKTRGGKEAIEKWIRTDKNGMKYVLKMDIQKYFDSVPHSILKQKLARLIHDKRFLAVMYEIVDAVPGGRGIPIGFYTSQWIANWYLTELDHYIKEELGVKHYIRYMDDMVIFGGNKRTLHNVQNSIEKYLNQKLGLQMKKNWQVYLFDYTKKNGKRVGRDLDFMGFRFYRDKTTLRRTVMLKATRKARRIAKKEQKTIYDARQMLSYLGWIDATDSYRMFLKRIKPYVSFRALRQYEGRYQRRKNQIGNKKGAKKKSCGTKRRTAA